MKVQYNCKFCGQAGEVEVQDEASVISEIGKWAPRLCCNRCADYRVAKRIILYKIKNACHFFEMSPRSKRDDNRIVARDILEKLVRRTSGLACEYYHKPIISDPGVVEALLESPERWADHMQQWLRTIKEFVPAPEPATTPEMI